ncbi:MAG: hypothetical protein LAP85_19410 [Acidobacteriia bacterium]|nr:hypothetical protein [Terriglobia bacterium]
MIYIALVESRKGGKDRAILTTRDPQFLKFFLERLILRMHPGEWPEHQPLPRRTAEQQEGVRA